MSVIAAGVAADVLEHMRLIPFRSETRTLRLDFLSDGKGTLSLEGARGYGRVWEFDDWTELPSAVEEAYEWSVLRGAEPDGATGEAGTGKL